MQYLSVEIDSEKNIFRNVNLVDYHVSEHRKSNKYAKAMQLRTINKTRSPFILIALRNAQNQEWVEFI